MPIRVLEKINIERVKAGKKELKKSAAVNAHSTCQDCEPEDDSSKPTNTEMEREQAIAALDAFMKEHDVKVQ